MSDEQKVNEAKGTDINNAGELEAWWNRQIDPAYPVVISAFGRTFAHNGLSMRDWFAGHALAGLKATPKLTDADDESMAIWAYEAADAMLVERAKKV